MTTYGINDNRKLTQDGNAGDGVKPHIYFRERPVIELTSEGIHAGDSLRLAVDVDKDFLATAPMAVATGEGEEGSATFALNCATSRFEEVINGRACLVCAYIQLTRWDGGNCEVLVDDYCYVGSLVSITGDDVEILPKPVTIPVPDVADAGKVIGVDDNGNYALRDAGGGGGSVEQATDAEIDERESTNRVITPNNLNYAVTAALTDSNHITLTAEQQATAQAVLNVPGLDANGKVPSGELPQASASALGIVQTDSQGGTEIASGRIQLVGALNSDIDAKTNLRMPITAARLDYAVRSVLPNITEIPAATSAYTLIAQDATTNNHCYCYEHAPESAPTYTLPAVTGNAVKREIILTVRFSASVLTYAFEDSQCNSITPLPLAGTIADGSVVCFRCTWEALLNQWVIMPVMLGTYSA